MNPLFPSQFRAGDTLSVLVSGGDYPSPTWTLRASLVNAAGRQVMTATAVSGDHQLTATAQATAAWSAGNYQLTWWVERGAGAALERYTLGSQPLRVLPLLDGSSNVDARSHARKVYDAICAVIENRATMDQEEYQIAGRSLKRTPITELLRLRNIYAAEATAEDVAAGLLPGRTGGRRPLMVRI